MWMNVDHPTKRITFHGDNCVFIPTTDSKYKKLMVYFVMVAGFILKIFKRHNPIMKKIIRNINAEVVMVAKKTN
ncbi:hypothetical protein ACQCVP_15465 [Rossellomorea vietnamensis]|uniref:hypothetical protein n=1 Tax=Rossellomorea vietnamensis TaxID=218284 RepID=UPI003CF704DC